jgi:YHS domain-containing protein
MRASHAAAVLAAALLAGCGSIIAQSPNSPMKPVNAVRFDDEPRLMLGGRDVVAYFMPGTPVTGTRAQRSEFERVAFYFASAENRTLFDANPQAYVPAYHGFCAMSMTGVVPVRADPEQWLVWQGRVFLFEHAAAKASFEAGLQAHVERADRVWRERVRGRNADWVRMQTWIEGPPSAGAPAPAASAAG